jgi:glycogen debranching enzyme
MTKEDVAERSRGPISSYSLKHDDTFVVADALGDIRGGADGLFRNDTRVLSRLVLTIGLTPPALLRSAVSDDNILFRCNATNRPLPRRGESDATPEGVIHLERVRFVWKERLHERLRFTNYGQRPVKAFVTIEFAADFADIFEVRGISRAARGAPLPPAIGLQSVRLGYRGLDSIDRHSMLAFSTQPALLDAEHAEFEFNLPLHTTETLYLDVRADSDGVPPTSDTFRRAAAQARMHMRCKRRRGAKVITSGPLFNRWITRSSADLALLETDFPTGPYPFAGIPWFSAPFGRDAIITALQTLWVDPERARGVLLFLAHHQARKSSLHDQSSPGKILHEMRKGEMASLGEVPFACYYGAVDSTPLFVMLAGAYAKRTADLDLIDRIWPALLAAVQWIEGPGDSNGDGLVDYPRLEGGGLVNQGWKDSSDSIYHADGRTPAGPVALVEVQGYVYAALQAMADLAARRNEPALHERWLRDAQTLRSRVEELYWCEDLKFYALALDGDGELCRTPASNVGHLLYTGLPSPQRAELVSSQLLSSAFDAGWGLRTVSTRAARYNPMSYHNGSSWPHDTSLCAAGMGRYGDRSAVRHLLNATFAAAHHFGMRLPELFCGFAKNAGEPPVWYPVACLPQAWSSGALFMLLQAALGIEIDAFANEIRIDRPELPSEVDQLEVRGLQVADHRVTLRFQRIDDRVMASATHASKGLRVLVDV